MYTTILRKIEQIAVFLAVYIVPPVLLLIHIAAYYNRLPHRERSPWFANAGRGLLVFLLMIKPISVITKRNLKANFRKMSDAVAYISKGRTQDPILLYVKNVLLNGAYSLSLYSMRRRKYLGILSFWAILAHRLLLEINNYTQGISPMFLTGNIFIQSGVIGLIMMLIGFLTSNLWSMQRFGKGRKWIQRVAYLAFLGACIHLYMLEREAGPLLLAVLYFGLKIREWTPVKVSPPVTSTPPVVAPATPSLIQTKVINHTLLTPQVMELVVEANQSVSIIPGQRALFVLHDEQGDFNRAYSLVDQDTDNDKTMMTFVIKLIPNGRAAKLREAITLGDTLNIKGVYGHLALQATPAPKVFIASSTGIAPLYNMMKHLPDVDKDLYFTVPTHADLFYEEQIKKLKKLTAHLHITREEIEGYNSGRIDVAHFSYPLETEFYVCGNPGIVKDIEAQLRTLGYTKFFNESF